MIDNINTDGFFSFDTPKDEREERLIFGQKDEREEREIYVPNASERADDEMFINKYNMDMMSEIYKPYFDYAKKYRLYVIDKQGKKVTPREVSKIFGSEKILKKDWVTFYAILSHRANLQLFLDELSDKERELLHAVIFNHYVSVANAQKLLGVEEMTMEVKNTYYWRTEIVLKPQYAMFYELVYAYGISSRPYNHKQGYLQIKSDLRFKLFHSLFSKQLKMTHFEQLPAEASDSLKIYNAEGNIFANLPTLFALFESNQIELRKSKVPATAVKKVQSTCCLQEFFPKGDKSAQNLCAHLVANIFTLGAATENASKQKKAENNVKALITDLSGYQYYLTPIFLNHIKGFRRNLMFSSSYSSEICDIIQQVLTKYAKDGWLGIDSISCKVRSFNERAEEYSLLLTIEGFQQFKLENGYNGHTIWLDGIMREITHPLIYAHIFALAAFGVVEIAYEDAPEGKSNGKGDEEGDGKATCYYDTLRFVRLTDLGKYVFGIDKKYENKLTKGKKFFELDDSSLIIRSLEEANPYRSVVSSIGTPITKRMYKVTYESFLESCNDITDILDKINQFREYICKEPPANWEKFFDEMLYRCKPWAAPKKKYSLLQIPSDDKNLLHIILSDPEIQKYTLKAEGLILLVERAYMDRVLKALKRYGYLL